MHAQDPLVTALSIYIDDRRVILPALAALRVALYSAMRAQRVNVAEMARRLNCHKPEVDRLLDLCHSSRRDQLESAFRVLGKRVNVHLEGAA